MASTDRSQPSVLARIAAFRTGLSAEASAAEYLERLGYRILARRFKARCGEIDLIAQCGSLVAFVEVKARGNIDDAAYAVTPRQQSRIVAAAEAWLSRHPEHAMSELRFDAILIAPKTAPRHLPGAFDAAP